MITQNIGIVEYVVQLAELKSYSCKQGDLVKTIGQSLANQSILTSEYVDGLKSNGKLLKKFEVN